MKIAIIGTAGRDMSILMTEKTWEWMIEAAVDALKLTIPPWEDQVLQPENITLVSGGAAWADHLAVHLYNEGHAKNLILHLPAPMDELGFYGNRGSSGAAANYYHERFSKVVGFNSIQELYEATQSENCTGTYEEETNDYSGMFRRNVKVVKELDPKKDWMIALTYGEGDQPADGGTKHTWDRFRSENKIHISIPRSV